MARERHRGRSIAGQRPHGIHDRPLHPISSGGSSRDGQASLRARSVQPPTVVETGARVKGKMQSTQDIHEPSGSCFIIIGYVTSICVLNVVTNDWLNDQALQGGRGPDGPYPASDQSPPSTRRHGRPVIPPSPSGYVRPAPAMCCSWRSTGDAKSLTIA